MKVGSRVTNLSTYTQLHIASQIIPPIIVYRGILIHGFWRKYARNDCDWNHGGTCFIS